MEKTINFNRNELGNIEIQDLDGKEIPGFIKHIELFKNEPEIIHLNITEEEVEETNNVYFYIRHHKKTNIAIPIKQLESAFANKNIYYETEKHQDKIMIINLFFYK